MKDDKIPCGVVAVLTDENGRSMAEATDFDNSRPGGFKLRESQEYRVRDRVALKMINNLCANAIVEVVHAHEANGIMNDLISRKKWKLIIVPVGHEESP